jgi:hypothetical protein
MEPDDKPPSSQHKGVSGHACQASIWWFLNGLDFVDLALLMEGLFFMHKYRRNLHTNNRQSRGGHTWVK